MRGRDSTVAALRRMGIAAVFGLLGCVQAQAKITVDGHADEPEWREAQVFHDFVLTEPLTRARPRYDTDIRFLARPEALYVAMHFSHPRDQRTHGRGPRDSANMSADPAILLIDFEGLGNTAYEFTVSLSGTQRDSIVLKQTQISRDWDGAWTARTAEDDEGWTAEWEIPWSIAPEGAVNGDKRTIGFYAARYVKKDSQRYAFPAIELLASNFVRDFHRIEVPRYHAASLDWFPYASLSRDNMGGATRGRAGLDVVWRPNGQNQLAAALLPDFGQVESDNLVVNFSAIETFFDEKRPFFTEGQQLFDLRTTQNGRLVNTRRIGAAADAGDDESTDVLAAAKYTGTRGRSEYGVFTAFEDDPRDAKGRRYGVARYHYKAESSSIGWLGTFTQRPTLDRNALVQSIDYDWRIRPALSRAAQAIVSDIRENGASRRGYGSWLTLDYQPGGRWQHSLSLTDFNRDLDFNDLGFQERADIQEVVANGPGLAAGLKAEDVVLAVNGVSVRGETDGPVARAQTSVPSAAARYSVGFAAQASMQAGDRCRLDVASSSMSTQGILETGVSWAQRDDIPTGRAGSAPHLRCRRSTKRVQSASTRRARSGGPRGWRRGRSRRRRRAGGARRPRARRPRSSRARRSAPDRRRRGRSGRSTRGTPPPARGCRSSGPPPATRAGGRLLQFADQGFLNQPPFEPFVDVVARPKGAVDPEPRHEQYRDTQQRQSLQQLVGGSLANIVERPYQ